jgi:hypothetical protein
MVIGFITVLACKLGRYFLVLPWAKVNFAPTTLVLPLAIVKIAPAGKMFVFFGS